MTRLSFHLATPLTIRLSSYRVALLLSVGVFAGGFSEVTVAAGFSTGSLLGTASSSATTLLAPEKGKFLPVEQAFQVQGFQDKPPQIKVAGQTTGPNSVSKNLGSQNPAAKNPASKIQHSVRFEVTVQPGHYVYQQRFKLKAGEGVSVGALNFDRQPEVKDDPEFGKVPVFHESVVVTAPVSGNGNVTLRWQGCAEAGLCYPPQTTTLAIHSANTGVTADSPAKKKPR